MVEPQTLEQVQEEKIAQDNIAPEFTPEQIQKARDIVESWREEAMQEVKIEDIRVFVNKDLVTKQDVSNFLGKWVEKYFNSMITALITNPRLIKTNQDMILSLEKALSKMTDDDPAYADIKATRMGTINQIKTLRADIANRKELLTEYETILSQLTQLEEIL